jgi:K+-transporting ATPase A subunit
MQECCGSIKRINLQTMGIKEREEMQAKHIGNKIIAENFPNLSFTGKWMELQNIILSEVNQVQLKSCMFSLI